MLTFIQSTDSAILFNAFADAVAQTRRHVFARTTVLVPSMTVRDDLDNRLADRDGISALLDAHFFGNYAWTLVDNLTDAPLLPAHPPLSRAAMQWRLFAAFAAHRPGAGTDPIDTLLANLTAPLREPGAIQERLWQLAGQFARLFARYLQLRPDWLGHWSHGQHASLTDLLGSAEQQQLAALPTWMQEHYQHIAAAQQAVWQRHFAAAYLARETRLQTFWQRLAHGHGAAHLPATLFVYGLENTDSDMHHFLHRLAAYTDIRLYYHAVSDGYFADMVDDRWLKRLQLSGQATEHHDSVHPLLSRFGKVQRDIFRLWIAPQDSPTRQLITLPAQHPPSTTLLATLQAEIRDLTPGLLAGHLPRDNDDSLRIHACHGLLRQLEALRGELVRWFRDDPQRQPADVLIVHPDPESVQNLIHTVFPPGGDYDGHHLPARLTGITPPAAQQRWQALAGLYTLPDSRFTAEQVLGWLRSEDVCAMLAIAPDAMQRLCDALIAAGFRRGLDSAQLGNADGDSRYTFCYALDRLLTGLWMPDAPLYRDTVPHPEHDSHGINALCELALHWQHIWRTRTATRPIREWIAFLQQELARRFPIPDTASRTLELSLRELDGQIAALDTHTPAPPVSLAFLIADIGHKLQHEQSSSEPSGVMTIGRINAMRTLPYKLIAFVGANMADFPANPPDDRYDLTRLAPRPGDPKPEQEDLAAFLDILRHAGEALWIFYDRYAAGGHDEQLPAQPVQELLAYLGEHMDSGALIREHPANPFQHDAPGHHPPPLWHQVRQTSPGSRLAAPLLPLSLAPIALDTPLADVQTLDFAHIKRPLLRPLAAWLQAHDLASAAELLPDPSLEPLQLDGLSRHQLDHYLIAHGVDARLPHLPLLPAGAAAHTLLASRSLELQERRAQLLARSGHDHLPPLNDQPVTLDTLTITVPLPPQGAPHLILHPGKNRDKHRLALWWRHLLWQLAGGEGDTLCAFADNIQRYRAVDNPDVHLRRWLNVRHSALITPWLLPVEIGILWANSEPPDTPAIHKALHQWRTAPHTADDPAAWQFITRQHDPAQIDSLILAHAERYAAPLYAPLYQYGETLSYSSLTPKK